MEIVDTIEFTSNWNNKLSCQWFTVVVPNDPKYILFSKYKILLNGKYLKNVEIRDIKRFTLTNLNSFIAGLDMGFDEHRGKEIIKEMYPECNWKEQVLYLVLLQTIVVKH